ncbi:Fe-S cluster assembly protein SufB [Ruminiclostridium cellobioparum]|uniref:FeS assembly protein SufB n=2 Tax=Ruminiclostridium cellobioparum TaxID=29355 RepID=S0FXU9_RUMCE|nr:Fe-S cluster assembly protein SufB [Ruminiclostridium cellobioparum]EMS73393.1 FeS assembly protein SufB [Ruminiclostridium cellobioparum subsp. termitidis CT1112]
MERKKTQVAEINRSAYDTPNPENAAYKVSKGLTAEIVTDISSGKNEPHWMLEHRLRSLEVYGRTSLPSWGPSLHELDMDQVVTYVRPNTGMTNDWDEVPDEIKQTFDRLGIPEAEKLSLSGVGAQYDSEVVYHSIKDEMRRQGVIYTDMDTALHEYEEVVRKHFMKLIPATSHKFAALHGAVWSGGSFVYVPKGVEVSMPLQSYFRLNAPGAGQFEHTLIILEEGARLQFIEGCSAPRYNVLNLHAGCVELYVGQGATLRYSTIENWSRNMMNLNSKCAAVEKNGAIEWVSGTFGSHITMLYPTSILQGEGARSEFTGISFASAGQELDTGTKVVHAAPNTSSMVSSKSISKNGGKAIYRSAITVLPEAKNSKSSVSCESLMLDSDSRSDTIPVMDIRNDEVDIGHEAKIGRISEETVFYLMTRGIGENEAKALIVRGFVEPIAKELPLEYAVEMNRLVTLEFEGSIG